MTIEERIDMLYGLPLERFTAERDALVKELGAAGDAEGAARAKALRKPVVAAWALNALVREDPDGVAELEDLGRRLRAAHRRAVSGGDVEPFREVAEERRALVGRLAARASALLRDGATGSASTDNEIASTLDAAAVDEDAATALREGRLVRPMRPPSGFGESAALTILPGGAGARAPNESASRNDAGERERRARETHRELRAAESRHRRAEAAVTRARELLQATERRRSQAKDGLKEAEAEQRGAVLEVKRLTAALSKLEGPA